MSTQEAANAQSEKIDKEILILASQLGNSLGFFRYYWAILPRCRSQNSAFALVNLLHYKIFEEYRYASYHSFRNQLTKKIKEI